jgi:hypothetical protein
MFNLNNIVSGVLNEVNPIQAIWLKLFKGQTNRAGEITATYYDEMKSSARIQNENAQNLQHINGLNLTKIYKRFYISKCDLTGLNRAYLEAGDYITWCGQAYKIVAVNEDFNTGWVAVVGCLDA